MYVSIVEYLWYGVCLSLLLFIFLEENSSCTAGNSGICLSAGSDWGCGGAGKAWGMLGAGSDWSCGGAGKEWGMLGAGSDWSCGGAGKE